jgi:hypothetical protein
VIARSGAASLAELVLVAWLFMLVLAGVATFALHQGRLAALQGDRVRYEEAVRTAAVVLGAEFRHLTAQDLRLGPDTARLRAFRGGGPVCAVADAVVQVLYRGVRLPEPAKDSVLLVGLHGDEVVGLVSYGRGPECGGSARLVLARSPTAPPVMALVFESGTYALSGGAIRYRRGEGGRQPLTEALLTEMAFEAGPAGVRAHLAPDSDSLPRLRGPRGSVPAGSLNAPAGP